MQNTSFSYVYFNNIDCEIKVLTQIDGFFSLLRGSNPGPCS